MSRTARIVSDRLPFPSRFAAGAVLVPVAFQLAACGEPARPVEPDVAPHVPALSAAPTPPAGLVVGAPLFGLDAAPDGSLLAAVSSAGIVAIRGGTSELLAELPGVNAVAAIGRGEALVVTGGSEDPSQIFPTSRMIFRVSNGRLRLLADLWAYEQEVNPDQVWNTSAVPVESNPFDVIALHGGRALVADAAANDILLVRNDGTVDWVAVLTPVSTPGPQPVPTSVAIGPDGAYYVGELTGFPGTPGLSRVWRIAPGSRHVLCPSAACTLVAGGFTSIMDLAFGPDGTLYVVELDEAGWLGMEMNGFAKTAAGGTVSRCNVGTGACSVVASGLSLPTAVAVDREGVVWIAEHEPILFAAARVHRLP
jgi:hypothetical protein